LPSTARNLFDWLQWIETLHPRSIELGLDRVHAVLDAMGLRHPPFATITVGGTNGKGSTVAMLDACLRQAGFRVGNYTSPHLIKYNERVRVDGAMATDAELCAAFERVEASRGATKLTYFEFGTLAALEIFRRCKIEIAVLEVGMGGRLDAVNGVDPDVAIVTSIGIDHTSWLGPDRESIGREKAGIFRTDRPAVCGDPNPPMSLLDVAQSVGAPLYVLGRDFHVEPMENGWSWRFGDRVRAGLPYPGVRGEHQLHNAASALVALQMMADRFPVASTHIRQGLLATDVPGRFQVLPGLPSVILDVAHNAQAAETLAANLRRQGAGVGRTFAVFSMLADKAIADVGRVLTDQVDAWYVAPLAGPRGSTVEQVTQGLVAGGVRAPIRPFDDVRKAFTQARADARPPDRVVVFGSFYTVGDILAHLEMGPA
jgi:dihydrofolate synthase / folylpolyglutamate synthase